MALDFPNSPGVGQVYGSYVWDGEKWAATGAGPVGSDVTKVSKTGDTMSGALGFVVNPLTTLNINTAPSAVAVANGANAGLLILYGLLVLHETTLADVSLWLVTGSSATLLGQAGTNSLYVASTVTPPAGKVSVAFNGTKFAIYNNRGSATTFYVGQYQT